RRARDEGFDFGAWPDGFTPKAAFFDMDSTLTPTESIVELARKVGIEREVAEITEAAMEGKLDFETALRRRVALLKGRDAGIVQEVVGELRFNNGVYDFMDAARRSGLLLFVVSGGFNPIAAKV